MRKLFFPLILAFLFSCTGKPVPYISDFPQEITVSEYETLPLDLLNPAQIFASSKYIAVLIRHEERMIWVYDRESCEFISSFISQGRGPNEVLNMNRVGQVDTSDGNLKLKVQSFPEFVAWLDIDASIREDKVVFVDKIDLGGRHNSANLIYAANGIYYLTGNSRLLMFMDPDRSGYKATNPSPFSLIYDLETRDISDTLFWYSSPRPGAPLILFSSFASMSPDRNYIGRANSYINSIIIDDIAANRLKTVNFDKKAMKLRKAEEEKTIYFNDSSANDDYFFALRRTSSESSSEIWVTDWNGEPVAKITVPLKLRSFFAANHNQVYAITQKDEIVMFESGL